MLPLEWPGPRRMFCCLPENAKRKRKKKKEGAVLKHYGWKLLSLINCTLMNCFVLLELVSIEVMAARPAVFLVISLTD